MIHYEGIALIIETIGIIILGIWKGNPNEKSNYKNSKDYLEFIQWKKEQGKER